MTVSSATHDVVFKNTHLEMIKREGSEYVGSVKCRHLGQPVGGWQILRYRELLINIFISQKKATPLYGVMQMHHLFLQNCRTYREF